ncbi:prefoldin subunit beta [Halapricum sp. CBA1109]|uniref:prefoldin subunit n=1 Tax=Halapricum sp. CBA1109 TaxID=2668068 RepID=UPI0012F97B8F|nr:prefoldin subunit [Halapricum sp. CBA1109]MUV89908.1 prefoldin subunit beta [Halapricum sp. CBA1109]
MQGQLPPAAQDIYEEMQELQAEAEDVVAQRQDAEREREAAAAAIDAIEDSEGDEAVYRRLGSVFAETTAGEARPALEAKVARLDDRIEALESTEEDLRTEFENRKEDIKHLLGGAGGIGTSE